MDLRTIERSPTRLVFCNRKLMRTDIFFTRTTKTICNFANSVVLMFNITINYTTARMDYALSARPSRTPIVIRGKSRWTQKSDRGNWFVVSSYKPRFPWWTAKKYNITCSYILIFVSVCYLNASLSRTCWVLNGVYFIVNFIFVFICNT